MELLEFTLAAGQTRQFERAGAYLEVIDADGRINVELLGRSGELADDMRNAVSGFYSGEPFAALQVSNGETFTQYVRLMVSNRSGGSRRQPGNVQIIDTVASTCTTDFIASAGALAFASQTILAAASNVNGLIVRAVALIGVAGAGGITRGKLLASPTTPTSYNPAASANTVLLGTFYSTGPSDKAVFTATDTRRRVPAGWGLFFTSDSTVAAPSINQANVSYELL